ncbi:hypothetical protein DRP04_09245 [Archaeoglobales archaeon]|nr:MAG: hypothetical protein DRP04_09245 [Archaeoglobales archaeon]
MTRQNGVLERRYRMVAAKVGENKYAVLSLDSTNGKPSQYVVAYNSSRFQCNCPDFLKHIDKPYYACKHIVAVYRAVTKMDILSSEAIEIEVTKKVKIKRSNNGNNKDDGAVSKNNLPRYHHEILPSD